MMGSSGRKNAMSPRTIEAADDVWEFSDYLANSLLFLLLGFELASTSLEQSFPGIFFGLLGAIIDRVLMDDQRVPAVAGCSSSLVGTPILRAALQAPSSASMVAKTTVSFPCCQYRSWQHGKSFLFMTRPQLVQTTDRIRVCLNYRI